MNLLINNEVNIITEWDGLYRLADIYKAAGSPTNKKPYGWLRTDAAREMIDYFKGAAPSPLKTVKGEYGGTYVNKLIALEYARAQTLSA